MLHILESTDWTDGVCIDRPLHTLLELNFRLAVEADDPFTARDVDVSVVDPDGRERRLPAFWRGGDRWAVRFAPRMPGAHTLALEELGLTARCRAYPYTGRNPLLRHGPIHVAGDGSHFEHADGTPFFLLADSWWFGMCERIRWPDEFRTIVEDRVRKGFSAIQFAVDFPCDIAPFDPRAANEAGHGWLPDYERVNPPYWDLTDQRILHLVDRGLVPGVVGAWGYYLPFAGREVMKRHWRYIVARYAALPVWWILCGESRLAYYGPKTPERSRELIDEQLDGWSEVGRYVKEIDPEQHPMTVHIGPRPGGKDVDPLTDMEVLDFLFTQPGHSDYDSVPRAMEQYDRFKSAFPDRPVMIGECAFEGMHGGSCGPKVQRNLFWTNVLRGAPGHCYGTDAMWQMNRRDEPFGASVSGHTWGNFPWEEAMHWAGSEQVGVGRRILEHFEWWRIEPHPEWVNLPASVEDWAKPHAGGIPGELRLFYFPASLPFWVRAFEAVDLEPDVAYHATYFDPLTGRAHDMGQVEPNENHGWHIGRAPVAQDWVVALHSQPLIRQS